MDAEASNENWWLASVLCNVISQDDKGANSKFFADDTNLFWAVNYHADNDELQRKPTAPSKHAKS